MQAGVVEGAFREVTVWEEWESKVVLVWEGGSSLALVVVGEGNARELAVLVESLQLASEESLQLVSEELLQLASEESLQPVSNSETLTSEAEWKQPVSDLEPTKAAPAGEDVDAETPSQET